MRISLTLHTLVSGLSRLACSAPYLLFSFSQCVRMRLFQKENGDQEDTRQRQREDGKLSCEKGRMKSFWRRHRSEKKTSSKNSNTTNQMKNMNKLEELKFDIRKISYERDELCRILNLYIYNNLNYSMNVEFTIIKSRHERTMLDIKKVTQSVHDAREKYKELIEDNYSYSIRYNHLLQQLAELNENIWILMNENRMLMVEQAELQASYEEEKRFCEEASKNINVPRDKQQQCETLLQKLEHGIHQNMISLVENCCRKITECAQQIHHCCLSFLILMPIMGCIFFISFGFLGVNTP
ncbi:uncharacterized protein LOC116104562 [Mastomys coucha]|uniref:uncharacterized protein LOC116104562 n=1 Tax=Mastomys coucha TaxID=35658 RepID=UPI00126222F7|nr:uncharacterized protein LOC116104562 [Mastomys coucha]